MGRTFTYRFATNGTVLRTAVVVHRKTGRPDLKALLIDDALPSPLGAQRAFAAVGIP